MFDTRTQNRKEQQVVDIYNKVCAHNDIDKVNEALGQMLQPLGLTVDEFKGFIKVRPFARAGVIDMKAIQQKLQSGQPLDPASEQDLVALVTLLRDLLFPQPQTT
ncbi:hypothetical protein NX722_13685 [Endozoicomonas gorgoniicola]|uniref:Uncharacterized protein n=1 Tax=Endozoicomonas gorgoniicola TaxID=1234144 RepID=A0ABT3MWD1_9GAMM|nr:hypothetical protein [Endozoicomonas gorgoniicola]MCW7553660.1 hypothetical protein [Endozoicomonas gorgoniicola]